MAVPMTQRPRVFVVHESTRIDTVTGAPVSDKDISPAEAFGTIVHVLPPGRVTHDPRPAVEIIEKTLEDITENDWLLLTGYPEYIAIAGAIQALNLDGKLRFLKWNKRRFYSPIEVQLPGFDRNEEGNEPCIIDSRDDYNRY